TDNHDFTHLFPVPDTASCCGRVHRARTRLRSSAKRSLGCAHRFRPTYALANVGHPSDFLCPDFALVRWPVEAFRFRVGLFWVKVWDLVLWYPTSRGAFGIS